MNYISVKVNISEGQRQKIRQALQNGGPVSIRLSHEDLNGEDVLGLTKSQVNKLAKAYETGKGMTIKMSATQVKNNLKVEGGFLGMLAGLAARALPMLAKSVLPALGVGALSGLASSGVQKVLGNGLFLKKGGCICQVESDGSGLYLGPATGSGLESSGDGLYIMKDGTSRRYGRGLLLGPNSPFKNIPILGAIL